MNVGVESFPKVVNHNAALFSVQLYNIELEIHHPRYNILRHVVGKYTEALQRTFRVKLSRLGFFSHGSSTASIIGNDT